MWKGALKCSGTPATRSVVREREEADAKLPACAAHSWDDKDGRKRLIPETRPSNNNSKQNKKKKKNNDSSNNNNSNNNNDSSNNNHNSKQ
mmetsp:Transcript_52629/g.85298  ORF Transcript_52629/g.85298 Transcript_52629/m.85298 type:complete len:90 (-) Transcript_52629:20-289(-)